MKIEEITNRFNQAAKQYDEQRRFFIPCFDDYYGIGVSFLASIRPGFQSILDLGAGTGLLSQYLYTQFPNAHYTLTDVSQQMLDKARTRFEGLKNFEYTTGDYTGGLPSGPFDLIASALSIHHLDETEKASLYTDIHHALPLKGVFINLDQFNATTDAMNNHYNNYWFDYIDSNPISESEKELWLQRRKLDKENTIAESIRLLKQAGFSYVECIYSYMKFGVLVAVK